MATSSDLPARPPVLRVAGELDVAAQARVTELLAPAVAGGAAAVVLLTRDVTFVDCAGLAPIREAAVQLRARGARLMLPLPAPALVRLAALTGCLEVLGLDTPPLAPPSPPSRRARPAVPRQLSQQH